MKTLFTVPAWGAFLLALCLPAWAHVTLEHPVAHAGSRYKANFKIAHGCAGSPTRQFVVDIPAGVKEVKPMPKPGWDLSLTRSPGAGQDPSRTGPGEVMRITWTAKTPADQLPDEFFDEFALNARLPLEAGPLYWLVSQICVQGRLDWREIPGKDALRPALSSPAPLLDLLPATPGAHSH